MGRRRAPVSSKIEELEISLTLVAPDADVGPVYLFDLASMQARWLSVRQATVAENVANASTPGYTAMDVTPFTEVYDQYHATLVATHPAHFSQDPTDLSSIETKDANPWEVTHSGNSVSVEQEMLKANEVNRAYSMNTAIVKSFNQMLSASVKG
jgi:flagellar basal-body rod protein FlgB